MAIQSVSLPDIDLSSLSTEDRAKLNEAFQNLVEIINDLVQKVNKEHPT